MQNSTQTNGAPDKAPMKSEAATEGEGEERDEAITRIKTSQRKTWQTSPEQVEELTRSLSRMRTDHEHGGYHYQKMIENEKSKTLTRGGKDNKAPKATATQSEKQPLPSGVAYDQPHLVNGHGAHHYTNRMNNASQQPKKFTNHKEPFLPPLTGFSDSDSSFSSFSCSLDGDSHQPHHDRQIQCICESLKKTKLEEYEELPYPTRAEQTDNGAINYIDAGQDWIVSRPTRVKPRDNLRLEGPMEMETTFRSTYESTAQQRMTDRVSSEDSSKSKRSNGTRRSKDSAQLYLNTRKGRTGATPILHSAKKRRPLRNRPQTSLKAGGSGSYSTNNREAYKNFVIVNGEPKMVQNDAQQQQQVKLPKVVSKTTTMTSEEKNRQKYVSSKAGRSGKTSVMETSKTGEKMVMIGGEEIRKFEKKSYIAKSDGGQEMTDVERKIIRKVKCPAKQHDTEPDKEQETTESRQEMEKGEQQKQQNSSPLPENITGAPKRPFVTRYQDNIKEMGLLDLSEENAHARQAMPMDYRHHTRRLHETSKDFLINNESPASEVPRPPVEKPTVPKSEDVPVSNKSRVINGHAVMSVSHKPFIIPQRINRQKNECSTNIFEGDMDFVTTNRQVYGNGKKRVGSAKRQRTAGRRSLNQRSGKKRNLFRESSDSMFSAPNEAATYEQIHRDDVPQSKTNPVTGQQSSGPTEFTSTYQKEFDDRLYCPALEFAATTNDNFKYAGQAGGHKYYLSKNYS